MKAILGFTRMSVRGINKAKRELGFVLMALNIRKVTAQRAENNQNYKRQFLYYFNRNCLFHLSRYFMSRTLFNGLLPFYSAWWLRSNVIDDTVYMVYFINYTTRNFCNTSQSIRAKSLVIPSIDVTARIPTV